MVDVNWCFLFWFNFDDVKVLIYFLLKRVDFVKFFLEEVKWLFDFIDFSIINYRLDLVEGILVIVGN